MIGSSSSSETPSSHMERAAVMKICPCYLTTSINLLVLRAGRVMGARWKDLDAQFKMPKIEFLSPSPSNYLPDFPISVKGAIFYPVLKLKPRRNSVWSQSKYKWVFLYKCKGSKKPKTILSKNRTQLAFKSWFLIPSLIEGTNFLR